MFGFVRTFIKIKMKPAICANTELAIDPMIKTIDMDAMNESDPVPPVIPPVVPPIVPPVVHTVVPVPIVAPVAKCEYENEMDVINKWKVAAKDDIVPLIAMIRQLYFFSDCRKFTLRTYASCKEDIPKYIDKIRRRPELQIDVSDMDVCNHPQMFNMYRRLRSMIGMFRVNDFMVRIEHAFDNSQIISENFVVSKMMQTSDSTAEIGGIDSLHHMVIPTCVQLNNIYKIPVHKRTLFHHISYSIQPIVFHSQTLDKWFKSAIVPPTTAQIMQLCIQMAEALAHLHALGIVHGDVKPGNTLIQTIYAYADSGSGSSSSDSDSGEDLMQPPSPPPSQPPSLPPSLPPSQPPSQPPSPPPSQPPSPPPALSPSLSLYLIDFGMSGSPGYGDGTGGTKPFCAPETGNGFNPKIDMDTYTWTKNQKHHDMWSFALIFFTMIVLHTSTSYPKDYPSDFFDVGRNGHINPAYFNKIQDEPMRELFQRALGPAEKRITAAEFLAAADAAASIHSS